MLKKITILTSIIAITGLAYWGLDQLKPSSTVGVELEESENNNVKEIKNQINDYSSWDVDVYKKINAKIDLKANMKTISVSEKIAVTTLLNNKNAQNIKKAFNENYVVCILSNEIQREIDILYKNPKYREFIKTEYTTKRKSESIPYESRQHLSL